MSKPIYLFSTTTHPDVTSINSLDITFFKPDIDFSNYDYLIITSKQTIEALKQYDLSEFINKKAMCVSNRSAESFKAIGGKVLDVGSGYGSNFVELISRYPKDTKWLYLHAKEIASDFSSQLKKDGFYINEFVVYESSCSKDILDIEVEDDSTLIFTSPSSVYCFLKTKTISTNNHIIVIGNTTAKALPKDLKYEVSKKRTIESCIELVKNDH